MIFSCHNIRYVIEALLVICLISLVQESQLSFPKGLSGMNTFWLLRLSTFSFTLFHTFFSLVCLEELGRTSTIHRASSLVGIAMAISEQGGKKLV